MDVQYTSLAKKRGGDGGKRRGKEKEMEERGEGKIKLTFLPRW